MTLTKVDTAKLAVVQMSMSDSLEENVTKAERFVREAAAQGANIVLLPELFENLYFCQVEREEYFALAHDVEGHPFLQRFQQLARELGVVLPISFFEKSGQAHYNSLAMIDADGTFLGVYRKSHIPDGPGYEEKYYFNLGDTGFKAWQTRYGTIGVGICWDQWYPETARAMTLQGAELLLYPTAIGSEPQEVETPNTHFMWQRAMQGHAVSNVVYLGAANRIGTENVEGHEQTYYGHSFLADFTGEKRAELGPQEEGVLLMDLDYAKARQFRAGMGFFRDRRPELYGTLLTLDGKTRCS
ncbi:N-carbamoylputrescine amidase [Deinococcus peraridilitoris]|uniref:N-carbamoylputrescine amidase n=1 Tax=Deinococcus peraridilitoris (strain DSM 19664 / LMG 22246 / CIP 109416 / KR-200) TaxID=937777 RepID=L0A3B5_DEIPD|nr:N-carbamoylputrescine amidase [Deinococcus peraridilitoris]AFZ67934.1 N-carbamoylputrescine amidase [Deinococcus peraridilitoris DSM 19664]